MYVAPIRALLNNQEHRLERYAGLIGRRAFKWHGDVRDAAKRGFISDPADVLLTTPESLEVMLMSRRVPAERLFRGLRAVVIDEIHAFVGDDRDVQRIGLSAVGRMHCKPGGNMVAPANIRNFCGYGRLGAELWLIGLAWIST